MAGKIQAALQEKSLTTADQPKSMAQLVREQEGNIKAALPAAISHERFTRIVLTALNQTPELMQCRPRSFIAAMMTAAQMGLEPNTPLGQAYLIPFDSKRGMMCQLIVGYRGLVTLAYGSGRIASVEAHTVHENDEFEMEMGLNPIFKHRRLYTGDRGQPIGYWAMFRTVDGGVVYDYMSIDEAKRHGERFSKSYASGPWKDNFDEMAKKTVLRKILKLAPLSPEARMSIEQDESVRETDNLKDVMLEPTYETDFADE